MKNEFSPEYDVLIKIYQDLHNNGTAQDSAEAIFDGKSLKFFFKAIKQLIDLTRSKSLIDFGCGKAKYYFEGIHIEGEKYQNIVSYWKINDYFLYDPGFFKFKDYPPKPMDALICIDVVEHIPEKDVINFIEDLFKLSKKFVFIVIACYPAKKKLPDGRNVHLSIKTPDEWKVIISNIKKKFPQVKPYVICSTERKKFITIS